MKTHEAEDRTRQLKSEFVTITFDSADYDKIVRLMRLAREHVDDFDQTLYEPDAQRLDALNKLLAAPLSKNNAVTLKLSHLDLFDLESTSHMAEGFPENFGGEAALKMHFKNLAALTDMLEAYRKKAFSEQYAEGLA